MLPRKSHDNNDTLENAKIRFPPWLITYSDLITLLLTFFILLMSMADLDPVRFNAASNSLKGAFGIRTQQTGPTGSSPIQHDPPIIQTDPLESRIIIMLNKKLNLEINELGLTQQAAMMRTETDTLLVRVQEALLFEPGQSQLSNDSVVFLDTIAESIADHPIDMRIEGHCDAYEPDITQDSAWELSTARAVSVLRYYINNGLLSADRLSAVGYGDTKPLVRNSEPSNRSLNRRVDIFLRAHILSGTGSAEEDWRKVPL